MLFEKNEREVLFEQNDDNDTGRLLEFSGVFSAVFRLGGSVLVFRRKIFGRSSDEIG